MMFSVISVPQFATVPDNDVLNPLLLSPLLAAIWSVGGRGWGREGPTVPHFQRKMTSLWQLNGKQRVLFNLRELEWEAGITSSLLLGKILNLETFFYLLLYWQIYYWTLASFLVSMNWTHLSWEGSAAPTRSVQWTHQHFSGLLQEGETSQLPLSQRGLPLHISPDYSHWFQ